MIDASKLKYSSIFVTKSCVSAIMSLALILSLGGCGWNSPDFTVSSGARSGKEESVGTTSASEDRGRSLSRSGNEQTVDHGDGQGIGGTGIAILDDEPQSQKRNIRTQDSDRDGSDDDG